MEGEHMGDIPGVFCLFVVYITTVLATQVVQTLNIPPVGKIMINYILNE
jgi:hypothetical protein